MKQRLAQWLWVIVGLLIYVLVAIAIGALLASSVTSSAYAGDLRRGELETLARVVQSETTGEPALGAKAVAWTVLNRLREPEVYGRTITAVVSRPYQYAKPAPRDDTSPAFLRALHATLEALLGIGGDPTKGAQYFYLCNMKRPPAWARRFTRTAKIGAHCFHRK